MKTMLDFINALTSLGIVGFLIYFFIYYRKPMKSVLDAIGDTDSLKAGPLEFKRRQQQELNKILSVQSDEQSDAQSKSEKIPEQMILTLYKRLLATSSLALALSIKTNTLDSDNIEKLKAFRDEAYHYVNSNESNSPLIAVIDEAPPYYTPPVEESQQSKP